MNTTNFDPKLAILNLWTLSCSGILPEWELFDFWNHFLKDIFPFGAFRPWFGSRVTPCRRCGRDKRSDWFWRRPSFQGTSEFLFCLLLLLAWWGKGPPFPPPALRGPSGGPQRDQPRDLPPLSDACIFRSLGNSQEFPLPTSILCPHCTRALWALSLTSQVFPI